MEKNSAPRLLLVAGVIFVIGLAAIVALFLVPIVADGATAPTAVYVLTMCAPIGFLLSVVYALRSGRRVR